MSRPEPLGPDRLFTAAEQSLDCADMVEVVLSRQDTALTRFADGRIHQNTCRLQEQAHVRVIFDAGAAGMRVATATTSDTTADGIRRAAERASEIAKMMTPDPDVAGLPAPPAAYPWAGRADSETARCEPARRAEVVQAALQALDPGLTGSGMVETSSRELAVVNSVGVRAHHAGTRAAIGVLAAGPDSTGYAEDVAPALSDLEPALLGRDAARKARLGARPREVPPGRYSVVLGPGATGVLVHRLAATAFAGAAVVEGRSPLSGRFGKQVCSPMVTIVDDPLSPLLPGVPFDVEGTPTRRLPLIERGVAVGAAYDRATARRAGTEPTGHAVPPGHPLGGCPLHLIMEAGDTADHDLVAGMERGLYVTRFHYTNVVHPVRATVTGTTRDGTFLVEDGRIVAGVRDLRFTESILDAFCGVEAVGRTTAVTAERYFGDARTPAVRLSSFTFTSVAAS